MLVKIKTHYFKKSQRSVWKVADSVVMSEFPRGKLLWRLITIAAFCIQSCNMYDGSVLNRLGSR